MAGQGRISSLWPEATTFEKRYRGYLWLATSVHCDQRPQHLSNNFSRKNICKIEMIKIQISIYYVNNDRGIYIILI